MNDRQNKRPPPASLSQPKDALRRSRWPVFFSALALVWCAWWYCREESQALLYLTLGLAGLALARTRALPSTTRWLVWSSVFIVVACLAANVTRLVPPDTALAEPRTIDQIVTAAFALGLTALFFRPAMAGVTLVAAGGLSLIIVVLSRTETVPGAAIGFEALIAWGLIALLVVADLAQRLARHPVLDVRPAHGVRESGWRLLLLAAVVALAFSLRPPVEWTAKHIQKGLLGWAYAERTQPQRTGDLWLTVPTSADFDTRMRMVLLIRAAGLPGYLRKSVFTHYRDGHWTLSKPEVPLKEASVVISGRTRSMYGLGPVPPQGTSLVWRVEVLSPAHMSEFCLPGSAVSLTCDAPPPSADVNGAVAAKETLPDTYDLTVAPTRLIDSAFPLPQGLSDPAYLEIPAPLAESVSNWVSACEGLSAEPTVGASIRRVETYFATNFTYRLGLRMNAKPDPLVDFMARKTGSCTLFASAAALMFRSCGTPSRVIAGYACSSWNPWLKRWVVRERDGHAWVEVWDHASGRWLVADPTPPSGNPAALKKPSAIRLALDLLSAGWKRLLAFLKGASFLEVLAAIGETLAQFLWHVVLSLPGLVVLFGFGLVWRLRQHMRRRKLTSAERCRADLLRAMEQIERRAVPAPLRRRCYESWNSWLLRLRPEVPPARFDELREWVESYQALRYRVTLEEAEVRAWLARAQRGAPHEKEERA